jgi:hypothetical protein
MKNLVLENYLSYLNEGLFFKPKCYCNILEYKQYGFDKIFYVGVKKLTEYYNKPSFGFSLLFPLTKPNYEDFMEGEETLVPTFRIFGGEKFSFSKILKILPTLNILDSGLADVKIDIMYNNNKIFNFRNMKTFANTNVINFMNDNNEHSSLIHLQLKRRKNK